jgi:uncharacterized protein (TIGR00369 family)
MSERPWERDGAPLGLASALGLRVVSAADGQAMVAVDVAAQHLNLGGTVHGGVIATLVDVAVAIACHSLDPSGPRRAMATTELGVTFLQASSISPVSCTARIRRRGRSLAVGEAEVVDGAGTLMALGRATYLVGGGRSADAGAADDAIRI